MFKRYRCCFSIASGIPIASTGGQYFDFVLLRNRTRTERTIGLNSDEK